MRTTGTPSRTRARTKVTALGMLLGVPLLAPFHAAGAQAPPVFAARPAAEAFYTRIGFDGNGRPARGVGGRLLWTLAPADAPNGNQADRQANTLSGPPNALRRARCAALGLFGAYTPEQGLGFSTGQFGLTADVTPVAGFPTARGGRVEPFLSFGAGALRTTVHAAVTGPAGRPTPLATASAPVPRLATPPGDRSHTAFLLVPSVGLRAPVRPGLALQGDVRRVLTFRDDRWQTHTAFGTGLRVTL